MQKVHINIWGLHLVNQYKLQNVTKQCNSITMYKRTSGRQWENN